MKGRKSPQKTPTPPRTQVGRKGEQIVRAARELFLRHGYAVTSMDSIAVHAGVSKATLYSHHANKEELFSQIVKEFTDRYSPALARQRAQETDVRVMLLRMARSIVSLALAGDEVAAHRMVVAEAVRSPEVGALYYEAGASRLYSHLEKILGRAMEAGQLRKADLSHASISFVALVMGTLQLEAVLCVDKIISKRARDAVIESGAEAFYRAYEP